MKLLNSNKTAMFSAFLSALLYAICIPLAKILQNHITSALMGGFLYLGAGFGLFITGLFDFKKNKKLSLTVKELPYAIFMVVLDILAIILLMFGISKTTSSNVSLLSNFELVATTLAAYFCFREFVSKRLFLAIILITIASIILTFEGYEGFIFNTGSILVLLSCAAWGLENNCTRKISSKDTKQITTIKGIFSGLGGLIIAFIMGENLPDDIKWVFITMFLGFVSYGISVCLYIYAQRFLGAAKTGAFYSAAPFFGVILSLLILGERPDIKFYAAFLIMLAATGIVVKDANQDNQNQDQERELLQ